MKITLEQRKETETILNSIYTKCWEDHEFKNNFVQNPKIVIEEQLGKKLTLSDCKNKIIVEDQSDKSIVYLNIPANEEINDIELTTEELELIAGGVVCGGACIGIIVGVLIGAASTVDW